MDSEEVSYYKSLSKLVKTSKEKINFFDQNQKAFFLEPNLDRWYNMIIAYAKQNASKEQIDKACEFAAAKDGGRDPLGRKSIAQGLLDEAKSISQSGDGKSEVDFDELLAALAHEENFMIED